LSLTIKEVNLLVAHFYFFFKYLPLTAINKAGLQWWGASKNKSDADIFRPLATTLSPPAGALSSPLADNPLLKF
jgi:hypothetical protein